MISCFGLWLSSVLVIAFSQSLNTAQSTDRTTQWTVEAYPNPVTQAAECGRGDKQTSYVCDPNGIITQDNANTLDTLIREVLRDTTCVCSISQCRESDENGFHISVALLSEIQQNAANSDGTSSDNIIEGRFDKVQQFTDNLLKQWSFGRCGENVVIVYSNEDGILYVTPGPKAGRHLTESIISEIAMKNRLHFMKGQNVFEGLRKIILSYREVFNGEYEHLYAATATPHAAAVLSAAPRLIATSHAAWLLCLGILFHMLLH